MMFTNNPFAALSASIPPAVMQIYVVLMVVAVVAGTLFDIMHKGSAKYFFENWRRSKGQRVAANSAAATWCRSPSRPASWMSWRPGNSATRAAGSPIC